MSSYTVTETTTFTLTHAKYLTSKVVADLKRIQRLYTTGPTDEWIAKYEGELTEYLRAGYLGTVTYGFKKNDKWIEPSVVYTSKDLAAGANQDDDPGKIRPGAIVTDASFTSYLTRNSSFWALTQAQRDAFEKSLPFTRGTGSEPGIDGYLDSDKSYSSGGKALDRSVVRKLQ